MRQNPHVRICGGPGSATTLVYPTAGRPDIVVPEQPIGAVRFSVEFLRASDGGP